MSFSDVKKTPEYQLIERLGLLSKIEFTRDDVDMKNMRELIQKYQLQESDRGKLTTEQLALYNTLQEKKHKGVKDMPKEKLIVPDGDSANWQHKLEEDPYYKIVKMLEPKELEKYAADDHESYLKAKYDLSRYLHDRVRNSDDKQHQADLEALTGKSKLIKKFSEVIEKLKKEKDQTKPKQENKGDKKMADKEHTTVENGTKDKPMENELEKKFHGHILYHVAKENGLLEGIPDKISTEDELNEALKKVAERIKDKKLPAHESVWAAVNEILAPDKPSDDKPAESTPVAKEKAEEGAGKGSSSKDAPAPRSDTKVEDKGAEGDEEKSKVEPSWVAEKKKFWEEFAKANAHTADFSNPDTAAKEPFYCSLKKEEKSKGEVTYTEPNKVQISKDSDFIMYQGIVKDVIESGNTLTLGKTLSDKQKLMLYAAALSSPDRYKDDGSKIQVMNPPALTPELIKDLPEPVQEILKKQMAVERLAYLRKVIEEGKKDEYVASLSKDKQEIRKAKEEERDKTMAARLGLTGAYETKYLRDIEEVKKDGKVITPAHKKGDKRIVEKEDDLIKNRASHVSDKEYARLVEKFKPEGR